ncbi:MAG: glycoside hydrolase family 28 protein [Prevotella sp.]
MKRTIFSALLAVASCICNAQDYAIANYGTVNDTTQLASTAINAAIADCHAHGGGRVVVPAGKYRCGTIYMKSHVELHLSRGAYLYASDDFLDFPMQPRNHYRTQKEENGGNALIYAADAEDIALTGHGTIDGRGAKKHGSVTAPDKSVIVPPRNILFVSCKNVKVRDITIKNAPGWNQHYMNCEDVLVEGITSWNHCHGNNDGIDIDGCRRFIVTNCIIDADDDAVVLKSTGLAPCEDVVVKGCILSSFANAIKCGTESVGGFIRILVSDCIVKPSENKGKRILKSTPDGITAISLELVDGGKMEDVTVNNILIRGTQCPLYIRLANRGRRMPGETDAPVGTMKNINISNVHAYATGNYSASITGIPGHRVENVTLSNVSFENIGGLAPKAWRKAEKNEKRHDMRPSAVYDTFWKTVADVVEDEKGYPQPTVWGNLPSRGLFLRHVDGIKLHNVTFSSIGSDPREDIVKDDVEGLKVEQ